jgi:hypothetical protein
MIRRRVDYLDRPQGDRFNLGYWIGLFLGFICGAAVATALLAWSW